MFLRNGSCACVEENSRAKKLLAYCCLKRGSVEEKSSQIECSPSELAGPVYFARSLVLVLVELLLYYNR